MNERTLKKAVKRAIENGFEWKQIWSGLEGLETTLEITDEENITFTSSDGNITSGKNDYWTMSIWRFLFDHSFAKAFWKGDRTSWDIHLQRMVLWPEPMKYLERFIA